MRLWSRGKAQGLDFPVLGRLTRQPIDELARRADHILYGSSDELGCQRDWKGYAGVLCSDTPSALQGDIPGGIYGPPNLEYLDEGDVVLLSPDGTVRVLYRRNSENNTILTTERCNSYCLMCSQPPREVDDSFRLGQILRLLELIDPAARELMISGGEPTLLGDGFFAIIEKAKCTLPQTGLHVLTNGRKFSDSRLARRLGVIGHPDLVVGIPLYSDIDSRHDYVVQAKGAYDETLAAFFNLAAAGVALELRVVLHKQTVDRLPKLAEFISRNLPFVQHVALMGLEMFGFTPGNLDVLWIDPVDYRDQLSDTVRTLALAGMNVSVYNHQLCTIPRELWPFARKSISDWKNVYLPECYGCGVRDYCGGFFQSATKRHSARIRRVDGLTPEAEQVMRDLFGPAPLLANSE